ncbi:MAG TPA: hypothetical protein VM848_09805 [Acidimicrobiia bacterium]|nr:hypothetical protein [Acidimicrobiia bacterium]
MSAMMFAYVQSRQLEIELEVERRDQSDAMSIRDRLGRTLIAWGEQLVTLPPVETGSAPSVRHAA